MSELKKKWLEALRSGEYRQGKQMLKYEEDGKMHHCCLGVLLEVLEVKSEMCQPAPEDNSSTHMYEFDYPGEKACGVLPLELRERHFIDEYDLNKLMQMNDDGVSFYDIADYIERDVEMCDIPLGE